MATGDLGENLASRAFMRIGWAPPTKISQDIGDDMLTFARIRPIAEDPAETWDIARPVLIQVKSSPTDFQNPTGKDGVRAGWWHRESDATHFDHWLSFGLPYLLVLVDTLSERAYWVHVESPKVISTGKGRKIFVPADQCVDGNSIDALNAVAADRRVYELEGRIWDGDYYALPEGSRLRNAMIVPRLIALHPNRSDANVAYEQAIAALLRNGDHHLADLARNSRCPAPADWSTHRRWGWRFAAAARDVVRGGDVASAFALAHRAPSAHERVACLVVVACGAFASGDYEEALRVLVCRPTTSPADRGWILALRAQILLELDRPDEASQAAQDALFALKNIDGDLSVSAIRGSCAAVLWAVSSFGQDEFQLTISAQDNAGSWWRAQSLSYALGMDLTDRFRAWASGGRSALADSRAVGELNAVAWTAAFGASWGNWRHHSIQLAQIALISVHDADDAREALTTLVKSGAKDEAKSAATRLWIAGPTEVVRDVVSDLVAARWLKRSEGPVMAVLAAAGDLLPESQADRAVRRIIDLIETEGPSREFAGGWSSRWAEIDDALARVLPSASAATNKACADFVTAHFHQSEHEAPALVRIAAHIDLSALADSQLDRLTGIGVTRGDTYGFDLLETLAEHYAPALTSLQAIARQGHQGTSRRLLAAGASDKPTWAAMGRELRPRVDQMIEDADRGKHTGFSTDPVHDLALAAYHTCNYQSWKRVTTALESGRLSARNVTGTLWFLARRFPELPAAVQTRLRRLPDRPLATTTVWGDDPAALRAATTGLRFATGQTDEAGLLAAVIDLRVSHPTYAVRLLQLWNQPNAILWLAGLMLSENARARAHAAYAAIEHGNHWPDQLDELMPMFEQLTHLSGGCLGAEALGQAIRETQDARFGDLHLALSVHPSSAVRSAVGQVNAETE